LSSPSRIRTVASPTIALGFLRRAAPVTISGNLVAIMLAGTLLDSPACLTVAPGESCKAVWARILEADLGAPHA